MKVLNLLFCYLLFAGFIPEISWLSGVENGRIYCLIGLELEGEQIERDLIIFEIRCQTGKLVFTHSFTRNKECFL
jgi:hypothetical protein